MTRTITAVYENGVLNPLEALMLQEHQKVIVQILPFELEAETSRLADSADPIEQEIAAYRSLHPMLKTNYLGHHVAIYNGKLIDQDIDGVALSRRVDSSYPEKFVLIRQVESEPERILHFRSPRFIEQY